jgi:hypothetical protein
MTCTFWKIDPKDKHIHKNKHDYTQIYKQNVFVTVELLYDMLGRRERKKNDRVSTKLKYITSVNVEDIMICIDSS